MKRNFLFVALLMGAMVLAGCNAQGEQDKEAAVKQFAANFAQAWAGGDSTAIRQVFPDVVLPDSFALPFATDSAGLSAEKIKVEAIADSTQQADAPAMYKVTLADTLSLIVKQVNDTTFSVTDSYGLFSYPAEKLSFAKKTGWVEEGMSDKQMQERFKDVDFPKSLGEKALAQLKSKVSAGRPKAGKSVTTGGDGNFESGYTANNVPIKNDMDVALDGKDYYISATKLNRGMAVKDKVQGVTILAHQSGNVVVKASYSFNQWGGGYEEFLQSANLVFNVTPEKAVEKYFVPTGGEYKAYLESKK